MRHNTLFAIVASILAVILTFAALPSSAQDKTKRPSPPGTVTFAFADGKTITINYSRPKMRGRKIYGGLVPYGEVWRAGANEATSFVTQADLKVGGTAVPAGSYTLFILPQESGAWKLIISKKTGEWGIPYPGEQFDLARVDLKTGKTPAAVEDFTISLDKKGGRAGVLKFDWENTSAAVEFAAGK